MKCGKGHMKNEKLTSVNHDFDKEIAKTNYFKK